MEDRLLDATITGDAGGKVVPANPSSRVVAQELSGRSPAGSSADGALANTLYSLFAFPLCRRVVPVNPLIGYYHVVSDDEVPHVKELYSFKTPAEFENDIDFLLRYYAPISLEQILAALEGKKTLPANSMHLTFDDGLAECFEVAGPILQKKGVPATFFLCSAFVDNKELAYDHKKSLLADSLSKGSWTQPVISRVRELLTSIGVRSEDLAAALLSLKYGQRAILDAIAECVELDFFEYLKRVKPFLTSSQVSGLLQAGHGIGAHSIDHPRYSDIPLAEQLRQTRESISFLRKQFALSYSAFSFPHSDAQVSLQFFREILESGDADVSFGNRGILDDCVGKNLQRITLEKPRAHARAILGRGYARRLARRLRHQAEIRRI